MKNIKFIVLGEPIRDISTLKPIEMIKIIDLFGNLYEHKDLHQYDFGTIELVSRNYGYMDEDEGPMFDVMFGYSDNNREDGILFLGHWNDGVVI